MPVSAHRAWICPIQISSRSGPAPSPAFRCLSLAHDGRDVALTALPLSNKAVACPRSWLQPPPGSPLNVCSRPSAFAAVRSGRIVSPWAPPVSGTVTGCNALRHTVWCCRRLLQGQAAQPNLKGWLLLYVLFDVVGLTGVAASGELAGQLRSKPRLRGAGISDAS